VCGGDRSPWAGEDGEEGSRGELGVGLGVVTGEDGEEGGFTRTCCDRKGWVSRTKRRREGADRLGLGGAIGRLRGFPS
jgi:hypothetical protein